METPCYRPAFLSCGNFMQQLSRIRGNDFFQTAQKARFAAGFFYAAAERRSADRSIDIFIEYAFIDVLQLLVKIGIDGERTPVFKPRLLTA